MNSHRIWWQRVCWLTIVSAVLLSGCAQASKPQPLAQQSIDMKTLAPEVSVYVDGGSYVPNISERITIEWKSGMTVSQALAHTGTLKLNNDETGIASVGDISLDPKMTWGVLLNDQEIRTKEQMTMPLSAHDQLTVYVKELDVDTSSVVISNVTLSIDGGAVLPSVTSTYAVPLEHEVPLIDVLKGFGNIELSKDEREVVEIDQITLEPAYAAQLSVNNVKVSASNMGTTKVNADDEIIITVIKK